MLPVKYGDERKLFVESLTLVKKLHPWVKGEDFLFDHSRDMGKRNARELWEHCTFNRDCPGRC